MFIRYLKIENYRGIDLFKAIIKNNLLSVVGQNDVGKSTVLRAIELFFGDKKMTTDDFPYETTNLSCEIEIHFECNNLDELKEQGLLKLKQVFELKNGKVFCQKKILALPQFPSVEDLDDITLLKATATKLQISIPEGRMNRVIKTQLITDVLAKLPMFTGYRWVEAVHWEDIAKFFPEIVLIPVSQDHSDEQKMTSDSSVFGKLFKVGIKNWLKNDPQSKAAIEIIENKVENINQSIVKIVEQKLKEQLPLVEELSQKLEPLDISKGFSFTMLVKDAQDVQTPLSSRGSGLQRTVLVAALRAQTEINKIIKEFNPGEESETSYIKPILLLFEEPESYLHLAAQKDLFYSLKDLSKDNQIFITTHSTLFMDETGMKDIVLLSRSNGKTVSSQYILRDEIQENLGEHVKLSELLTSNVCCIVEGISDKLALEKWMERLGFDRKRLGIHFISMDGCKNMDYYANITILTTFNVPFRILLDTDRHGLSENLERKKYLENKIPRLKNDGIKILEKGELENYYCLDTLALELRIPKEIINVESYELDPKAELESAKNRAIGLGLTPRRYKESEHSRLIAANMPLERIDPEIIEIINDLIELSNINQQRIVENQQIVNMAAAGTERF